MLENKGRKRVLGMISYMLFADNVGSLEVIFDKILLKINRFCWSIDFFCIFANSIRAR